MEVKPQLLRRESVVDNGYRAAVLERTDGCDCAIRAAHVSRARRCTTSRGEKRETENDRLEDVADSSRAAVLQTKNFDGCFDWKVYSRMPAPRDRQVEYCSGGRRLTSNRIAPT